MIVHVDMDAFFVAVEELLNPALRGKAVAVGGSPTGRGVVASASYEARRYGVHSAMPSFQARRLCPQLIFVQAHYAEYARYSDQVAQILGRYSPEVDWVSIDEAYINLYGCDRLYGPPSEVAEVIRENIRREAHLSASLGIARNRLMAKVASDFAKPGGLVFVLPGYEEKFLRPLPVRSLPGIGPKMEQQLQEMGIQTVGELAAMPQDILQAGFGINGVVLSRRARGMDGEMIAPTDTESKSISREITLEEDTVDVEHLASVLHLLVERAAAELRKTHRKARTVTLKLRYSDFKRATRSVTLDEATALDEIIFGRALDLLRENEPRRVRIRLIGIHLSHFEPETGQLGLFTDAKQAKSRSLHEQLDQVRERFGFDSVQAGRSALLKKDHHRSWEG